MHYNLVSPVFLHSTSKYLSPRDKLRFITIRFILFSWTGFLWIPLPTQKCMLKDAKSWAHIYIFIGIKLSEHIKDTRALRKLDRGLDDFNWKYRLRKVVAGEESSASKVWRRHAASGSMAPEGSKEMLRRQPEN